MIFLFILMAYVLIGALLSMHWVKESIEIHGEDFDSLRFLIRCCFKWPCLIANKDLR